MYQVKVFAADSAMNSVYRIVEHQANSWLAGHPEATIVQSHSNLTTDKELTTFALTLLLELPEPQGGEIVANGPVLLRGGEAEGGR